MAFYYTYKLLGIEATILKFNKKGVYLTWQVNTYNKEQSYLHQSKHNKYFNTQFLFSVSSHKKF